ncbi:hypothetical protein ACR30L_09225 [Psychromonas sp. PT13]
MSTIATNVNKTHNTHKKNNVFIELVEVISLWAVAATTILLIGITTWA